MDIYYIDDDADRFVAPTTTPKDRQGEWLHTGWYYDSMGDAVGPFTTEADAIEAFREDEEW